MCNKLESNRAEIDPSELATKCRAKSKKGVSIWLVTLDKVTLGGVFHVVRYCVAVSAHVASCVANSCTWVEAAHAALCMMGFCVTVTKRAILGMLLQFGCCIQDAAAVVIAAPPKSPEAKSRGLVDLFLLFTFPRGQLKRVFILFGLC